MDVIHRYLDCGDLHYGFARVKCKDCGHEFLLPFSCKRRHFCPSCHQKRVVEFGEWLCEAVLKYVPHRQWVFSIPKRLRIYFILDRSLLVKLSQCAWKVLSTYLKQAVPYGDAKALKIWRAISSGRLSLKSGWHIFRQMILRMIQRSFMNQRTGRHQKPIDALDWLAQLTTNTMRI